MHFYRADLPTDKRVRKWGISLEDLITDQLGKIIAFIFFYGDNLLNASVLITMPNFFVILFRHPRAIGVHEEGVLS